MSIAKKIEESIAKSSWIRRMFEDGIRLKEQYGSENVFDFTLGNPFPEPPEKLHVLIQKEIIDNKPGMHGYMPNAGYVETRQALAAHLSDVYGVPLTSSHIVMTCGAGGALNVILKTLLDPQDEVIAPVPFFVEYQAYTENHGGVFKSVASESHFALNLPALEQAITPKTKAVLINSPNNPSGKVYERETIDALATLLKARSTAYGRPIYLISDEPYRDIVYDGTEVPSILAAYPDSLVATSFSKTLSIPGERIGYIAASPGLADGTIALEGLVLSNRILGYVNAPALMQRIIPALLGVTVDIDIYKRKRDLLCDGLAAIGYEFTKPMGAFYLFPESPLEDEVAFVRALQAKNILTVPGRGFGAPGFFRIAYCVADETIMNAMPGFEEVFKKAKAGRL